MEIPQKRSIRSKIYLLIIIIISFLGINFFLLYKTQKQNQQIAVLEADKVTLKREIDTLEAELIKINAENTTLNTNLQIENESIKRKLNELKLTYLTGRFSKSELEKAKKEITELKKYIVAYKTRLEELNLENVDLKIQNNHLKKKTDSFNNSIGGLNSKLNSLSEQNVILEKKIKSTAALKAEYVEIIAKKSKPNSRPTIVEKAKQANKLDINYNITPNLLAEEGIHTVYMQVFDPSGKLIAPENNKFEADGEEMTATYVSSIEYNRDVVSYKIEWNNFPFEKGTYTVVLFSDGTTLGKGKITLK
ncbi:MAG: hypothetical protein K2Q03_07420 [Sphingobacteriaceae bacterium]|nr:hypothetical protein [Sphingobacteriaceae bacterium]